MAKSKRHIKLGKSGCSCSMPGVWRAVAYNAGAVVIFHSPKACGHVSREMDLGMHFRAVAQQQFVPGQYTAPLIVSGLQEEHSIFGGTEQLRQCIDYVIARYKPEYIVIANSCVAGVIGDDAQAVAGDAEQKWNIPIMAVPCYGFLDGDYYTGFYHASRVLIERLMVSKPTIKNTVTLLSNRGGLNESDVQEMKQLLYYFGLQIHCQFPTYATVEDIQRVSSSALCVLLGSTNQSYPWLRKIGTDLQERFGVPFFDSEYPAGWQNTKVWLTNMGQLLQQESQAKLAIKEQEIRLNQQLTQFGQKMKAKRTVLCIGRPLLYFNPTWVLELFALSGAALEGIILLPELTGQQQEAMQQELAKQSGVPVFRQNEGDTMLEAADIVLTTHELADTGKRQLFLPLLLPVGVSGLIMVMHKIIRLAERHGVRGGIVYV
jgi:nitrogenase molybdenum-iron protein alpha chain